MENCSILDILCAIKEHFSILLDCLYGGIYKIRTWHNYCIPNIVRYHSL